MRKWLCLVGMGISLAVADATARAWDAGGHMIAAQIAYDRLSPELKARVDQLVPLAVDLRRGATNRRYDFVSLACWMDDVRDSKKREAYASWHYINVPCGGDPRSVASQNALDALDWARVILRSPDASDKIKAEWLAIALHLIGDLHQPLHCTDRDLGGNSFPIKGVPGIEARMTSKLKSVDRTRRATGDNAPIYGRLHTLWDAGYRYDVVRVARRGTIKVLYEAGSSSKPNSAKISEVSRALVAGYLPVDASAHNQIDATIWIKESNAIACDWAFATPPRRTPALRYFERLHDTNCTRLALAGARMAAWLEDVFSVAPN